MKSCEKNVNKSSDYYVYLPTTDTEKYFLYPLCIGRFIYETGYSLRRNSYNSFLLMYIEKGSLDIMLQGKRVHADAGEFVIMDCYLPHGYESSGGWISTWLHFDGHAARKYYEMIIQKLGNVFSVPDAYYVLHKMQEMLDGFRKGDALNEIWLSGIITDILTCIFSLDTGSVKSASKGKICEQAISYIHEHISEKLSIEELSQSAMMSPYHFLRVFTNETGYTPHQYIIRLRINMGEYLLISTDMPVSEIAAETGFSSEAAFCTAFRKQKKCTPGSCRLNERKSLHTI